MDKQFEIKEKNLLCNEFQDSLTNYLDGNLDKPEKVAMAEHSLRCPMCHALINAVKSNLELCHELPIPKISTTKLEARILQMTAPETAMSCKDFENYLTDYLDGFLPAALFHRWERHATLCTNCEDLPGMVVRSIGACYTYKHEELPLPFGLNERILETTIGTVEAKTVKASWVSQFSESIRKIFSPILVPQLAPVAAMLLFAVMFLSQTVSADGLGGVYRTGFQMAQQTYEEGTETVVAGFGGKAIPENKPNSSTEPTLEPTYVDREGK